MNRDRPSEALIRNLTLPQRPHVLLALAILVFAGTSLSYAQSVNPLEGDVRAIRGGAGLFRAQCATCHGADAKGISSIEAPDLTQIWSRRSLSAAAVFEIIRLGIPGSIMPPHSLTDTENWMLVAYLQSVAEAGVIGLPAGDPATGRQAFVKNCSTCHRAHGLGESLGPNLSNVTSQRSLESLIASVRDPDALVGRGYKLVHLRASEGEEITGLIKSEDAFSMQLQDATGRLRSVNKADLQTIERLPGSLMPAFALNQLGDQRLFDIFNFLQNGAQQ
ncbi:MAG: c-type cytochrome [Pseudomonadota bacterium]|nr:c-type cytochrome [Pseudomonadota bacterium]